MKLPRTREMLNKPVTHGDLIWFVLLVWLFSKAVVVVATFVEGSTP